MSDVCIIIYNNTNIKKHYKTTIKYKSVVRIFCHDTNVNIVWMSKTP